MKPKTDWFPISDERDIKFSGLRSRSSLGVIDSKEAPRYKSDLVRVHERDVERWNALDLSQWEFYIVTCKDLTALNTSSISLRKLRQVQQPISAAGFRQAFQRGVARHHLA